MSEDKNNHVVDVELDATNVPAPVALLQAMRALREMTPGQLLAVVTDNSSAIWDFQALSDVRTLCELVDRWDDGPRTVHILRCHRASKTSPDE